MGFWLSGSGRIVSICSGRLTARYTRPNQPGKTGLSCGAARRNSFSRIRVQGQVLQKRALPERKRPKGNLKIGLRKGSWKAQSFQDPFALAVYPGSGRRKDGISLPDFLKRPASAGVPRFSVPFCSSPEPGLPYPVVHHCWPGTGNSDLPGYRFHRASVSGGKSAGRQKCR